MHIHPRLLSGKEVKSVIPIPEHRRTHLDKLATGTRFLNNGLELSSVFRHLPTLAEKASVCDAAGSAGGNRDTYVHDGVVGEFWHLAGVVEIIVFAEGEAAVEDDVFGGIERIWVNQERGVMIGWKGGFADSDGLPPDDVRRGFPSFAIFTEVNDPRTV